MTLEELFEKLTPIFFQKYDYRLRYANEMGWHIKSQMEGLPSYFTKPDGKTDTGLRRLLEIIYEDITVYNML